MGDEGQYFVGSDTEGINVRPVIQWTIEHLLRGHVCSGAGVTGQFRGFVRAFLRQVEVAEADIAVGVTNTFSGLKSRCMKPSSCT